MNEMPLPPINVSSKVWFAHRHKAAGHSVAAELNDIVAGGCASLTCCTTQHAELAQLREWWLSPEPTIAAYPALRGKHAENTTCLTNEDELLPLLWHRHRALLLPWLEKHRVDLYISGHSHHTEHLQYGRTHFLVVGAGSGLDAAPLCDDNCAPQSVHRFRDALGFATLTLGRDGGEAALRDGLGATRHSFKF